MPNPPIHDPLPQIVNPSNPMTLAQAEADVRQAEAHLQQIQLALDQANLVVSYARELRNIACSRTHKFPPEVLSEILTLACSEDSQSSLLVMPLSTRSTQLALSLVCRRWNKVILSTPALSSLIERRHSPRDSFNGLETSPSVSNPNPAEKSPRIETCPTVRRSTSTIKYTTRISSDLLSSFKNNLDNPHEIFQLFRPYTDSRIDLSERERGVTASVSHETTN